MDKWDNRFLELAWHIASWSKDPSTKVGCILVDSDRHIISTGYNGFPRGVEDSQPRLNFRETKYMMVQHAEANAVLQAVASTKGSTAYVTHHPCSSCAGMLIQAGVKRVVTNPPEPQFLERFKQSFRITETMFKETGIKLDII